MYAIFMKLVYALWEVTMYFRETGTLTCMSRTRHRAQSHRSSLNHTYGTSAEGLRVLTLALCTHCHMLGVVDVLLGRLVHRTCEQSSAHQQAVATAADHWLSPKEHQQYHGCHLSKP